MNTNAVIFVLLLFAVSFVILGLPQTVNFNSYTQPSIGGIHYGSVVCVKSTTGLDECTHNIVVNNGLDLLKNVLGGQQRNMNATWVAVGNSTPLLPTDTKLNGEFVPYAGSATACGLLNATGTYVNAGTGAWNITYTFTSSCNNVVVNATALYNSSTGGTGSPLYPGLTPTLFAEANFTQTTLQISDQINVTWGIYITTSG